MKKRRKPYQVTQLDLFGQPFPKSKKEARNMGASRYYTGKRCKYGHLSERDVSGTCVACDRRPERRVKKMAAARAKRHADACSEEHKINRRKAEAKKRKTRKNRTRRKKYAREYRFYRIAIGKWPFDEIYCQWVKEHPERSRLQASIRRTVLMKCTPPWADLNNMKEIYRRCYEITSETRIPHEVDHIVPLRGAHRKGICIVNGLNIPINMQIIPKSLNRQKNNSFDESLGLHPTIANGLLKP